MKTEAEVRKRFEWTIKAIDDEDNNTEAQQIKLWAQLDFIKWLLEI